MVTGCVPSGVKHEAAETWLRLSKNIVSSYDAFYQLLRGVCQIKLLEKKTVKLPRFRKSKVIIVNYLIHPTELKEKEIGKT